MLSSQMVRLIAGMIKVIPITYRLKVSMYAKGEPKEKRDEEILLPIYNKASIDNAINCQLKTLMELGWCIVSWQFSDPKGNLVAEDIILKEDPLIF